MEGGKKERMKGGIDVGKKRRKEKRKEGIRQGSENEQGNKV